MSQFLVRSRIGCNKWLYLEARSFESSLLAWEGMIRKEISTKTQPKHDFVTSKSTKRDWSNFPPFCREALNFAPLTKEDQNEGLAWAQCSRYFFLPWVNFFCRDSCGPPYNPVHFFRKSTRGLPKIVMILKEKFRWAVNDTYAGPAQQVNSFPVVGAWKANE